MSRLVVIVLIGVVMSLPGYRSWGFVEKIVEM